MSRGFHGKTYMYPTPNEGEQEIGVIRFTERDPWMVVGYVKKDGMVQRVLSASIPCETDPDKLQKRLDNRAAKLQLKPAAKAVVVRECMEATQVLPPDSGTDLPHTPQALTEQFKRAMAGLRECLRFGAMIAEIDAGLSRQTRSGCIQEGDTLKAWLAANCPEVDYGWALKYKRLAENLRDKFNLTGKVTLSLAIPAADVTSTAAAPEGVSAKRVEKIRKEVDAFLAGKTAWQLEFAFGLRQPVAPKGGDVKSGKKLTEEEKHLRERKEAKERWDKLAEGLSAETKTYKSHLLLDGSVIDTLLLKLDVVRDCLKEAKGKE